MDGSTLVKTLRDAADGSLMTPDEARQRLNLPPLPGGDQLYKQQQNYSLGALAKRDALPNPFVMDKPTSNPTPSAAGSAEAADPAKAFPFADFEKELDEAMHA